MRSQWRKTMARRDRTRPLARPASPRLADAGIPHPSWRETITGADRGAGRVINARDFWARLDI